MKHLPLFTWSRGKLQPLFLTGSNEYQNIIFYKEKQFKINLHLKNIIYQP